MNEMIHLRTVIDADYYRAIHLSRVIGAMEEIVLFSEDWTMSDYRRFSQQLVVYLRHHSDGDISAYGEFITPFVITDCEFGYGEDIHTNPVLDRFLRDDARLWYATELLRSKPETPACLRVSSYDNTEWVKTVDTPLLTVLADRGFRL